MAEKQVPFFTQTALLDRYIHGDPAKLSADVLEIVIRVKTPAVVMILV